MKIKSLDNESEIAYAAAKILRESFIKVSCTETVLYVQNDVLWSKVPNCAPVFSKKLAGRNPDLAKKISSGKTYKIKKRTIST